MTIEIHETTRYITTQNSSKMKVKRESCTRTKRKTERRIPIAMTCLRIVTLVVVAITLQRKHSTFRKLLTQHSSEHKRGLNLAFIHELEPKNDQGGNVRALRALEDIVSLGISVELYTRTGKSPERIFKVSETQQIKLFGDEDGLNLFKLKRHKYDVVISTMWFWRFHEIPNIRSLPLLVYESSTRLQEVHITLTDDIHYIRCMRTLPRSSHRICARIQSEEEFIWRRDSIVKVFVAAEDKSFVSNVKFVNSRYLYFIPFPIEQDPVNSLGSECKFAYYGSVHTANIMAVEKMLTGFNRVAQSLSVNGAPCSLYIIGYDKWSKSLTMSIISETEANGINVNFVGRVFDLRGRLSKVTLAVLPVTLGDTGVSSKVFTAMGFAVPFISSPEGKRGFICDRTCALNFFSTAVEDILLEAMAIAHNSSRIAQLRSELITLARLNKMSSGFTSSVLVRMGVPLVSVREDARKIKSRKMKKKCKKCSLIHSRDENCFEVCTFFVKEKERGTTIHVSAYTSLKGTNDENAYIDGFLRNAMYQDLTVPWELVIACVNEKVLKLIGKRFLASTYISSNFRLKTVLLAQDFGLYETWDYLIQKHTSGGVLLNWNVDDRKSRAGIRLRYEKLLSLKGEVVLVSSPTVATEQPYAYWEEVTTHPHKMWFTQPGMYGLSNFVSTNTQLTIEEFTNNYPHNSPVYLRQVHEQYGYFSQGDILDPNESRSPTCSDYRFWVRVALAGERFYHMDQVTDLYRIRADSYERTHDNGRCVEGALRELRTHILYNNDYYHSWIIRPYSKKILVALDSSPVSAQESDLLFAFISSAQENAHEIDVLSTADVDLGVKLRLDAVRYIDYVSENPLSCYHVIITTMSDPIHLQCASASKYFVLSGLSSNSALQEVHAFLATNYSE